jgi:Trk K+ transport system NAD-binding subunit
VPAKPGELTSPRLASGLDEPAGQEQGTAAPPLADPPAAVEQTDHVILCGANALAARMAEELTVRYGLAVTAIVPSASSGHGAAMAQMPSVHLLEQSELTAEAFLAAYLPTARGLAILDQDDLGNFHAALRAQEVNPQIRLVIAMSNVGLGYRLRAFFADCAVLSEAQMAAPSLVAAALGEPAPSHVRLAMRTLYVARREDVGADHIVCGVAASSEADTPLLLPPADTAAGLVLAVADGTPRNPLSRRRRHRLAAPVRLLRRVLGTKMAVAFATLTAILCVGYVVLAVAVHLTATTSLYLTLLDAAGAAVTGPQVPGAEKVAQFLLTFDGMAFLPLVTALIVSARLPGSRNTPIPLSGHVIVAGLGDVGSRILGQLHDLGVDVVGVDKNPDSPGAALAHRLGVPVVVGETQREETLRHAGICSCAAIVSVTDSDITNLETGLNARALSAEPRIVIRLYDDDLASRVQHASGKTVSRSTSYLAAPAFAAAVLDHQVLRTIAVGRHVLLLAEIAAGNQTGLAGSRVADVHQPGLLRVIAIRPGSADGAGRNMDADWSPAATYLIQPGDRVVVLATRSGLSGVLRDDTATAAQD